MAVINPPESKLAKGTCVHWGKDGVKWNIKRLSGQEDPVKVCLKTLLKTFPHEKTMQFLELAFKANLCKKVL